MHPYKITFQDREPYRTDGEARPCSRVLCDGKEVGLITISDDGVVQAGCELPWDSNRQYGFFLEDITMEEAQAIFLIRFRKFYDLVHTDPPKRRRHGAYPQAIGMDGNH